MWKIYLNKKQKTALESFATTEFANLFATYSKMANKLWGKTVLTREMMRKVPYTAVLLKKIPEKLLDRFIYYFLRGFYYKALFFRKKPEERFHFDAMTLRMPISLMFFKEGLLGEEWVLEGDVPSKATLAVSCAGDGYSLKVNNTFEPCLVELLPDDQKGLRFERVAENGVRMAV